MFNISRKLVYLGLASVYVASCFGFDKTTLAAITAAAYIVLAFARDH